MSVAGLKKQFYKASQVSGGQSGGRALGAGLPGVRGQVRLGPGSRGPGTRRVRVPCRVGRTQEVCGLGATWPRPCLPCGLQFPREGWVDSWMGQREAPRGLSGSWTPSLLPLKGPGQERKKGKKQSRSCRHRTLAR